MSTRNRRRFIPQSIWYFLRQGHSNKELITLDDGEDAVADLIPADERVCYTRLDRSLPLGAKRNLDCEMSRDARQLLGDADLRDRLASAASAYCNGHVWYRTAERHLALWQPLEAHH